MDADVVTRAYGAVSLDEIHRLAASEAARRLGRLTVAVPTLGAMTSAGLAMAGYFATPTLARPGEVVIAIVCGFVIGSLVLCTMWTALFIHAEQRLQLAVDEDAWRPRQSCRHPVGRSDTHDRHEIVREIEGATVTVGVRRWRYDRVWRAWNPEGLRSFSADELDEAEAYERTLLAGPPFEEEPPPSEEIEGCAELLARWVEGRPDGFGTDPPRVGVGV